MIVNKAETKNFSAVSATNISDGQATPILYMSASVNANKEVNFSKNIRDFDLYKSNQEEADADWNEFQTYVISEIG